jgi:hypothetical protein
MSTQGDPDRLVRAFLDEGPSRLSDRARKAVLADVHRTRQRARFRVWRPRPISRTALALVTAIALLATGELGLWLREPPTSSSVGGPSPLPSAAAAVSPSPSSAPASVRALPAAAGPLTVGTTYFAGTLSRPLTFTLPSFPQTPTALTASSWPNGRTLAIGSTGYFAVTIHDGVNVANDLCDNAKGTFLMQGNPDAIEAWLHASSSTVVGPTVILRVDGRLAVRWDAAFGRTCKSAAHAQTAGPGPAPEISIGPNEIHRFYAIPTGKDTLLVITWAYGNTNLAAVNAATDTLVESIIFP